MENTSPEWQRLTFYTEDRTRFREFVSNLETTYDAAYHTEQRELYQTMLDVLYDSEQQIINRLGGDSDD